MAHDQNDLMNVVSNHKMAVLTLINLLLSSEFHLANSLYALQFHASIQAPSVFFLSFYFFFRSLFFSSCLWLNRIILRVQNLRMRTSPYCPLPLPLTSPPPRPTSINIMIALFASLGRSIIRSRFR